jgi:hypothetical protein
MGDAHVVLEKSQGTSGLQGGTGTNLIHLPSAYQI